ncbi:GNAT family N-acetyltransferase [Roseomonas marmotae]|uniref:GNAT family N-acetyltransferase n=1 Tax=Roseomonas marmotae TaxID=2768161 RepID=A0ABS3K9L0_9PROT|nr:GNAT family N-acetyltransferase [Roseomonas marmotae]MBO1074154.1 GNAT family N-acetyltransferase [Roseomonas marmotae]QTI78931.1 GNAT family N-acetyltransferase [Roseomonas marmotae]
MPDEAPQILPIEEGHREAWEALYAGYAAFYRVEQTPEMRARVWGWLMDPAHDVKGFLALRDGRPIGLAHYRPYWRPLYAGIGGFLDDLFVDPAARGGRVADALIAAVADEGRRRGWGLIRWITADNNYRGRAVYDRVATLTPWRTYDIKL